MIEIEIDIDPGQIRINRAFQARAIPDGRGGKRASVFKSKAWKSGKATIANAALEAMGERKPLIGPVRLTVWMWWPREQQVEHAVGIPLGDIDAPLKAIQDGLADGGVYQDDGQITALVVRKEHSRQPRIRVRIEPDLEVPVQEGLF